MSNQEQQQESKIVEEREYTIEKQVVGMGYMSFYDEEDMRNQIVYCSNGCWKLKGDKTSRDLDGDLCITDDEEEEEEEHEYLYTNLGTQKEPRFGELSYLVAGGGMFSIASATIELKDGIYYFCEYLGRTQQSREAVGTHIVWSDEIYDKKNPDECRSFDVVDMDLIPDAVGYEDY